MERIQEGEYDFPAKVRKLLSIERKLVKAVINAALFSLLERLSMTSTADGKRQRYFLILSSFLLIRK